MKRRLAVITVLMLLAATTKPTTKPASLGDAIATYARSQRGRQVGDGECTRLLEEALRVAGGEKRRRHEEPADGDYVWGELLVRAEAGKIEHGNVADIRPGDLMQFRDAKFERNDRRGLARFEFSHHSAVVDRANAKTGSITVLHQNINGKKTVTELTLELKDLKAGWVRIYRATSLSPPRGAGGGERRNVKRTACVSQSLIHVSSLIPTLSPRGEKE